MATGVVTPVVHDVGGTTSREHPETLSFALRRAKELLRA